MLLPNIGSRKIYELIGGSVAHHACVFGSALGAESQRHPPPILPRMLHLRTLFCSDLPLAFWLVIKKLARHRLQR